MNEEVKITSNLQTKVKIQGKMMKMKS